jgi:hypothetical protein
VTVEVLDDVLDLQELLFFVGGNHLSGGPVSI